jgi:hypothetical protein
VAFPVHISSCSPHSFGPLAYHIIRASATTPLTKRHEGDRYSYYTYQEERATECSHLFRSPEAPFCLDVPPVDLVVGGARVDLLELRRVQLEAVVSARQGSSLTSLLSAYHLPCVTTIGPLASIIIIGSQITLSIDASPPDV